jgi:hypothetical protein
VESFFIRKRGPLVEDALTAALGDLIADLDNASVVKAFLGGLRAVDAQGRPRPGHATPLPAFNAFELELWPSWKRGEPDLFLHLRYDGGSVAGVVVEVKYGAAKSGEDVSGDDYLHDQLARYAADLDSILPGGATRIVAYVTASPVPPHEELAASWLSLLGKTRIDPSIVLHWCSWQAIHSLLGALESGSTLGPVEVRRLERLRRLLESAGLGAFEGWRSPCGLDRLQSGPPVLAAWLGAPSARWDDASAPIGLAPPPPASSRRSFTGWKQAK